MTPRLFARTSSLTPLVAPLLVAALAPALLPAQGMAVVPPANAAVDGNSLDLEPLGLDQCHHVQYVDRSLLTAVPPNATLKELAYRRDSSLTGAMTRRASVPIWQINMGNYAGSALNPEPQFPQATSGWTTVFSAKQVNVAQFPDLTLPATGLPSFDVKFVFDQPFVFAGPGLGIQHYVYEGRNQTYYYYMDSVQSVEVPGTVDLIVPGAGGSVGCPAGANRARGTAPNPGGTLELFLFDAPSSAIAFAAFGSNTTSWSGVPLPLDLAPLGLAGCSVYTDWQVIVPRTANPSGIAEFRAPVPNNKSLAGASIYAQWAVRDDRVNPQLGLATSDGLHFTLGPSAGASVVPMSIVSNAGGLAGNQRTPGFVQPGHGLVFRLAW